MFLGLVILLSSHMPVDLVARILPPKMAIAENAPVGTVIGPLFQDVDGDSMLEIVAAIPQGAFDISEQSAELTVVDPTSLDFETLRHVVLVVRETRAKSPDRYRSLFVNKLLRDGAQPHQITRFTADTYYHLCVVEITDVEETPQLDRASDSTLVGEDKTIPGGQSLTANSDATDSIEFSILTRQSVMFSFDQIAETQAYLDRRVSLATTRKIADGRTGASDLTLDSQTAIEDWKSSTLLLQAIATTDAETSAAVTGALPHETSVFNQSEQFNKNPSIGDSPKSSISQDRQSSALWWLVASLVTSIVSACGILLSQTLYDFEQKHSFIRRLLTSTQPQQDVNADDETIDASPKVCELLDESDLRILASQDACKTSPNVAEMMQRCLSELEVPCESGNLNDTGHVSGSEQSLAASSKGLTEGILSETDADQLESVLDNSRFTTIDQQPGHTSKESSQQLLAETTVSEKPPVGQPATSILEHQPSATHSQPPVTSTRSDLGSKNRQGQSSFAAEKGETSTTGDEVERLKNLIRSEFGLETRTSQDIQPSVPHRSCDVTTSHNSGTNLEKNPPPEIDLTDFRQIAHAACQHAIVSARTNLRNRRIRGLLMYAALGCSIVCGLTAILMTSNGNGRSLLVSMAIMSLLGYMLSCRTADESE